MRLLIKQNDQYKHSEMVNAVSWTINKDVYSISDDNIIYKWDSNSIQCTKFMELDNYPTDIEWLPLTKGTSDVFAIGFVDGSFKLITKLAKVEKTVGDAHKGALICLKWSHDGQALVTCGEDGQIKHWSRSGNLRSTLAQVDKPIYSVSWSPDSESILFCSEKNLYIKPIQAGFKQITWKAHDGIVLKCDWNTSNNLIVSGGEDCRYKVWDSYGRLLYSSNPYDFVITSVSWAPNGEYFAVGAFDMIKLCDKTGWTQNFNKTNIGSLMKIAWSSDSTMCAGAAGNGQVLFGNILDKTLQKEKWEIKLIEDNKISVFNLINESTEELDFKERVINMSLSYDQLIITTSNQCLIYNINNLASPHLFDIKDKDAVNLIIQSPKYFCLIMVSNGILIYNYEGKQISNPKVMGIKFEYLNKKRISISQDILAIVDGTNNKKVQFFDVISGKQMQFILEHSMEIIEINLNQNEISSERKIGYVDSNRDLYLSPVHKRDPIKLSAMTDSFLWNENNDILAAVSDGRLLAWYYPNAIYVDRDLMEQCKITKEAHEIGRMTQMLSFSGSQVTLRRKDGGLITLSISPYPNILFDFCDKNKWEKALKLCRYVKEPTLWACLAAISLHQRELNTAEIALASIEQIDKVQFINYSKELPSEVSRQAALNLYFHKSGEAEQLLINNKLFYRAIKLNIKLYRWERALQLAQNNKVHLDTVIAYRKRYLEQAGKDEFLDKFKQLLQEVKVDWKKIKDNIKQEKEREEHMERNGQLKLK